MFVEIHAKSTFSWICLVKAHFVSGLVKLSVYTEQGTNISVSMPLRDPLRLS